MVNYIVVSYGHISLFEQWEPAKRFARDFDGAVYNLWGLQKLQSFSRKYPAEAAIMNKDGDLFRGRL